MLSKSEVKTFAEYEADIYNLRKEFKGKDERLAVKNMLIALLNEAISGWNDKVEIVHSLSEEEKSQKKAEDDLIRQENNLFWQLNPKLKDLFSKRHKLARKNLLILAENMDDAIEGELVELEQYDLEN